MRKIFGVLAILLLFSACSTESDNDTISSPAQDLTDTQQADSTTSQDIAQPTQNPDEPKQTQDIVIDENIPSFYKGVVVDTSRYGKNIEDSDLILERHDKLDIANEDEAKIIAELKLQLAPMPQERSNEEGFIESYVRHFDIRGEKFAVFQSSLSRADHEGMVDYMQTCYGFYHKQYSEANTPTYHRIGGYCAKDSPFYDDGYRNANVDSATLYTLGNYPPARDKYLYVFQWQDGKLILTKYVRKHDNNNTRYAYTEPNIPVDMLSESTLRKLIPPMAYIDSDYISMNPEAIDWQEVDSCGDMCSSYRAFIKEVDMLEAYEKIAQIHAIVDSKGEPHDANGDACDGLQAYINIGEDFKAYSNAYIWSDEGKTLEIERGCWGGGTFRFVLKEAVDENGVKGVSITTEASAD